MDERRLKHILAVIGVAVALCLAGAGLAYALHDQATAKTAVTATATKTKKAAKPKPTATKKAATATVGDVAAKVREISEAYNAESAYKPYGSGPYADETIYALLEDDGVMDDVNDEALSDEIKAAGVWPSDSTPEVNGAEIDRLQNAYDAWHARLWKTACDRFETVSIDEGMMVVIKSDPDCMGGVGDPPENEGTKESYQAMVDWYENAATVSDRCAAGR